ncbi:MAG TPA: hypothetical protein VLJ86_09915 [Ramlibacter sp.]|nr:hypothetical protein [Ramlibacter sp.]
MSNASAKTAKASKSTPRSFTWNVTTTEIAFMGCSAAEAARDGSSNSSNDCSAIAKFDAPRQKRPAKPVGE